MATKEEVLIGLFARKDVKTLCKMLFGYDLAPKQEEIVRIIAFEEKKRICINAMTRYGKTRCVAMALLIYILMNTNKKCALIAPTEEQAKILRDYLSEMIKDCWIFHDLIQLRGSGIERLDVESSRKRQTFKNGCEYRVYSAEGGGARLMGHGVNGIIVKDECCLIPAEAEAKILRMAGDNPDGTMIVELANPWDSATQYHKHWVSSKWYNIHVDWEVAVAEGRTTKSFVDDMRDELKPLEFTVLYDSDFPAQSEDALFDFDHIQACINKYHDLERINVIIGADIADKGLDDTVITTMVTDGEHYEVQDIYSEAKSESTSVAGRIIATREVCGATIINIDAVGVGVGVVSMVKEGLVTRGKTRVNRCMNGERSVAKLHKRAFANKKAEMYFKLAKMFQDGVISIPNHEKLISQLLSIKWDFTSSGKIKIVDPDDSPDFADSLMYCVWDTEKRGFSIA